jgi:hypothetical protein
MSPVVTPVVPTKPNGHSSMTPTAVPSVPSVQPAATAPSVRSIQHPRCDARLLLGRKQTVNGDRLFLHVRSRSSHSPNSSETPPKLAPPTPKEDGEIDPSRPSSPLAKPIPRQVPRGWEETPKQPRAFKLNGPNATGSASPASPAVSRDGHGSGPSRANAGWRGGRGGHPPTGPRALRENGPAFEYCRRGYGPRWPMTGIGIRIGTEMLGGGNGTGAIVIETGSGIENVAGGSSSFLVYVIPIAA